MSKSVGNVLDPFSLVDQYGLDYVRYFMMAEVPLGNDGDFSDDAFVLRVNSNLANELGNLVQRVTSLCAKNCGASLPGPSGEGLLATDNELLEAAGPTALAACQAFMTKQQVHRACDVVIGVARLCNKYIDVEAPWALAKSDPARMRTVLFVLAECIRRMGILLGPVMPDSCSRILDQVGASDPKHRSFASLEKSDCMLVPGTPLPAPSAIFPRLERDKELASASLQEKQQQKKKAAAANVKAARRKETEPEIEVLAQPDEAEMARLRPLIVAQGERIRGLKASKVDKEDIKGEVATLLALKRDFKVVSAGQDFTQ